MFACEQERVAPDLLCLGKGLTSGYMPLAATLTTERIYEGFLGEHEDYRTFFHGHTFTGNPLACAAGDRQPRRLRAGAHAAAAAAEDPAPARAARGGGGDGRGRRGPRPRAYGRDRPRRARPGAAARPPGDARGARARRDRPAARRHDRADAAAGDQQGRPRRLVAITAESIRAAHAGAHGGRRWSWGAPGPPRRSPRQPSQRRNRGPLARRASVPPAPARISSTESLGARPVHRLADRLGDHRVLEVGGGGDRAAVQLDDHVLGAHAGAVGRAAGDDLDDLPPLRSPKRARARGGSGRGPPAIPR